MASGGTLKPRHGTPEWNPAPTNPNVNPEHRKNDILWAYHQGRAQYRSESIPENLPTFYNENRRSYHSDLPNEYLVIHPSQLQTFHYRPEIGPSDVQNHRGPLDRSRPLPEGFTYWADSPLIPSKKGASPDVRLAQGPIYPEATHDNSRFTNQSIAYPRSSVFDFHGRMHKAIFPLQDLLNYAQENDPYRIWAASILGGNRHAIGPLVRLLQDRDNPAGWWPGWSDLHRRMEREVGDISPDKLIERLRKIAAATQPHSQDRETHRLLADMGNPLESIGAERIGPNNRPEIWNPWLILADHMEEHGLPQYAALVRNELANVLPGMLEKPKSRRRFQRAKGSGLDRSAHPLARKFQAQGSGSNQQLKTPDLNTIRYLFQQVSQNPTNQALRRELYDYLWSVGYPWLAEEIMSLGVGPMIPTKMARATTKINPKLTNIVKVFMKCKHKPRRYSETDSPESGSTSESITPTPQSLPENTPVSSNAPSREVHNHESAPDEEDLGNEHIINGHNIDDWHEDCDACRSMECPNCGNEYQGDHPVTWSNGTQACDDCSGFCDACNEHVDPDDMHTVHNSSYDRRRGRGETNVCEDCFNSGNYFTCADCDDDFRSDHGGGDNANDERVCDSCAENYFYCDSCGNTYNNDDYGSDGNCRNCEEGNRDDDNSHGGNVGRVEEIHDYGYEPDKWNIHGSPHGRHYGAELETVLKEGDSDDLQEAADKTLDVLNRDLPSESFAFLKEDSSLHGEGTGSFEIVTHPATLDFQKDRWGEYLDNPPANLISHDTGCCGLHVHVGRKGLSELTIGKILAFVNSSSNRKFIESIARRSSDHYARLDPTKKVSSVKKYPSTRYEAINLQNPHTIEFRIFKGTLNKKSFFRSLEFVDATVEFAKPAVSSIQQMHGTDAFFSFVARNKKRWPLLHEYCVNYQQTEHQRELDEAMKNAEPSMQSAQLSRRGSGQDGPLVLTRTSN